MKQRQSFVSNSSTTSFCIYGTRIENFDSEKCIDSFKYMKANHLDEFKKRILNIRKQWEEKEYKKKHLPILDLILRIDDINSDEESDIKTLLEYDTADIFCQIMQLGYWPDYDGDNCYFGQSWPSIGDDETGGQFKKYIKEELMMIFGDNIQCSTHEEAWRDG